MAEVKPPSPPAPAAALSSPVEDDKARASALWDEVYDCHHDVGVHSHCGPIDHMARAIARIRAEAAAAEREAALEICERLRARSAEAYDIMQAIRARGPSPAAGSEEADR